MQVIDLEEPTDETKEWEIPPIRLDNREEDIDKGIEKQETRTHQGLLHKIGESSTGERDQDITENQPPSIDKEEIINTRPVAVFEERGKGVMVTIGQSVPPAWLQTRIGEKASARTSSLSLDDLFTRVGEHQTKERKKPKTYLQITRDAEKNPVVHVVVPPQIN